jgi:hypothetical protein
MYSYCLNKAFPGRPLFRFPPNDISFTNKGCVPVSVYRSVHSLNRPAHPQMISYCSYGSRTKCDVFTYLHKSLPDCT